MRLSVGSIKTADGEDYVLSDTDIIFLDVKKSAVDRTAVFSKTATAMDYVDGVLPITIYPEDTAGLPPGDYFFDVRLFMDEDNIYTIVPMSKLKIVRPEYYSDGRLKNLYIIPDMEVALNNETEIVAEPLVKGNIDLTGYEYGYDKRTGWYNNLILRQEIVHLDISDVPDHPILAN